MTDKSSEGHIHKGGSSKWLLDAKRVVKEIDLEKGDTFLDLGCGDGYFSIAASAVVGGKGRIYAVDVDEKALASLKKEIHRTSITNIEAMAADVRRKIPLGNGEVDICFLANVMHGFLANNEFEGVMKEVARVLKANGIIAVVDFKKRRGMLGPPKSERITEKQVEEATTPYGFKKEKVVDVGRQHYMILLKRA